MEKKQNRWVLAIIGVITLVFVGLVYSWTVLQAPISAQYPEWSAGSLSLTFTLTMIFFCLGGFSGGHLQKKFKPRTLLWITALCMLAGFFVSSRAATVLPLYLGFGALSGFASGLAYNIVMSTVGRWFPDRQGLISGLLLMGFGMGSFVVGKIYTIFTPSDGSEVWRISFLVMGAIIFVIVAAASFFLVNPPEEWLAPDAKSVKKQVQSYAEMTTVQMIKTSAFWLFFVWSILMTGAALIVISQGTPIALQACPGTDMGKIATVVGLISIFNGLGRIVFGLLFDKIGRFWEMLIGGVLFIVAIILVLLAVNSHSMFLLVISYIMTGFAYGVVPTTNSAFASLFFGMKNYPVNYSIINMVLLPASFGSTVAGLLYDSTGSYFVILYVTLGMIVISCVLSCLIRKPKQL